MRRPHHILLGLLVIAAAAACDNGSPWNGGGEAAGGPERHDFGPSGAFDRRFLFVGPGTDPPTAAVFDFVALSDSARIRRGARLRLLEGGRWVALLDAGWEMAPMREPWRLVPRGPFKVVVSDAGELSSLNYRTDSLAARLELDGVIDEHSPDAGTQLVLRRAILRIDDTAMAGVLLDAQLGRALEPAPPLPSDSAAAGPPDSAAPASAADTANPTPSARPGAEALVMDGEGYFLVLATASGRELAWVAGAGPGDVIRGTRLEPTAWADLPEAETQVPTAWRLLSPQGRLAGELDADAADRIPITADGAAALGYVLVTGWVEDRGARRDVFGLVRHVR